MKEEIKEKWVAALRSGDYQQGTGYLHRTDGGQDQYCCLGVLCELAIADGIPVDVHKVPTGGYYQYGGKDSFLPREVIAWAGMEGNDDPEVHEDGSLSILNDTGHSFAKIADLIEENL